MVCNNDIVLNKFVHSNKYKNSFSLVIINRSDRPLSLITSVVRVLLRNK